MPHYKTCCNRWWVCNKFDSIKNFSVKVYIAQQKHWERFEIKKLKIRIQKQFDLGILFFSFNFRISFHQILSWSLGLGHLFLTNIVIFLFIFWVSYEILAMYARNTFYEIRMRKVLYKGSSDITFLTSFPTQSQLSSLLPIAHHTWSTQTIYSLH